jgi:hypothetical protein
MVCELCAPRASAEGWLRETEQALTLSLSPARPRQGRNPLARWRRPRRLSSESAPEPVEASATPADDERDDELHEVVESAPGEPVAGTAPVFAGVPAEPVVAEAEIAEMDASEEVEPAEEGSWRDAWMFVEE